MIPVIDELAALFATQGNAAYHGEAVSQREHALQAARLAELERASAPLIAAALLHDVGHLLTDPDESFAELGQDDRHEIAGAHWLADRFGPEVIEPIRLHVDAKRYLCAVRPDYFANLSPASVKSLALQGGPMSLEERERFEAGPRADDAIRLRRWDDEAKVAGHDVPDFDQYRPILESLCENKKESR